MAAPCTGKGNDKLPESGVSPAPAVYLGGFRGSSPQQPQDHAVNHAGGGAEYDHRPRDQEHFGGHAGDQALCLCQDRTHNFFAFLEFYDSVQL